MKLNKFVEIFSIHFIFKQGNMQQYGDNGRMQFPQQVVFKIINFM